MENKKTQGAIKLKQYRQLANIKLEDLAKVIGVSVSAMSLWEDGKRYPKLYYLRPIQNATNGIVKIEDWCE